MDGLDGKSIQILLKSAAAGWALYLRFPLPFFFYFECQLCLTLVKISGYALGMSWACIGLILGVIWLVFGSKYDVKLKRDCLKLFRMHKMCFGFKTTFDFEIK